MENLEKVRIFDTTLRDGEQTPGVSVTPEQKLRIAIKLDELGVDAIEAGFPVVSDGEKKAIKIIVKQKLKSEICGLARAMQNRHRCSINCDLNYIHTFIATSDIHMVNKLNMTRDRGIAKSCLGSGICKKTWFNCRIFRRGRH